MAEAHYHPSIWDNNLIESFSTSYSYKSHANRLEQLKIEVKRLLSSSVVPAVLLKHIDAIQRLGVAYHFENETKEALSLLYPYVTSGFYSAALQFRLLRKNGFSVNAGDLTNKSPIIISISYRKRFWISHHGDNKQMCLTNSGSGDGRFMYSLSKDPEAILSLYEASHLGMHGEDVLDEALNFSTKILKSLTGKLDNNFAQKARGSLVVPLHWRFPRIEARHFIDVYQKDDTNNLTLLELAKMGLTKFVCTLTTVDDRYDVYGLPHELECFIDAVNRWDMKAVEELPEYMKLYYVAMHNFANELVFDVLKDHSFNVFPHINEEWVRLCNSYSVEAKWFCSKYTPRMDEYLGNAWISVGGHAAIIHANTMLGFTITEDTLKSLKNSRLIYRSSLITRLKR
ncbi:Terpene synthase [Quillaja saponaria]|uniref:Terpene synthase n=1 Tax=Quillaja saponaria TaxID=32244 RepID=A0AAD7L0C2_QUISA|nr:Terpene synthase [Quillaja saponaria]